MTSSKVSTKTDYLILKVDGDRVWREVGAQSAHSGEAALRAQYPQGSEIGVVAVSKRSWSPVILRPRPRDPVLDQIPLNLDGNFGEARPADGYPVVPGDAA